MWIKTKHAFLNCENTSIYIEENKIRFFSLHVQDYDSQYTLNIKPELREEVKSLIKIEILRNKRMIDLTDYLNY